MGDTPLSRFEQYLSVPMEEIEFTLRGFGPVEWSPFWLNPRRLRGSDFLMRWSQGVWSEERLIAAVNQTQHYRALPYGPSSVAPSDDTREFEIYFERLEKAGLGKVKRPDVLIFRREDEPAVRQAVESVGGLAELPFTAESELGQLLRHAVLAVECENSLWVARKMPNFGEPLRPMPRLGKRPGLPKNAVLPTVIMKEEDREPLRRWQSENEVPIHIWHVFHDSAYGLPLDRAEAVIEDGLIGPTEQVYQAPNGIVTKKITYRIYYHYAYALATSESEPDLEAKYIEDKNGHILPYVRFRGGALSLSDEAIGVMDRASRD